ncbi:Uncharacterised protein [Mycobacterium tuberculosis]|uniref:Uncharacterized protein n=1 Tax=Mycobacterium tuberculosis TaxID=1773 RepID=A0A0U0QZ49_MYCTX|nr:Uncharacterised protein [Mycobacterium tuberculosis]CKS74561.1 Uncharacterised protein [Mycobacterium tuberculosis]CNU30519.1 Uncharacterised protein [Mycobacterium tuberculosis]CNU98735.1 Uncharacterised protein [Mycobacterium tuberculosis]CNV24464.1 Uncharacterised protein [Mycobacterium tuberculosis]
MVCDDAVPHVVFVVADVVGTRGDPGHGIDDRPEQVGLVDVVHVLQHQRDPLDAHAGVDVLAGQRPEDLVVLLGGSLSALVLHEHQVPDLEVAVFADDGTACGTEFGSAVVIDLR